MSLLPFFTWCEQSAIGEAIRNSQWLFPVIESVHLLALVLIAGAVLVVDMRLFGLGLRQQPVAQLARDAQPWLIGGLMVMLTTGILLFLSEAIKCYYSAGLRGEDDVPAPGDHLYVHGAPKGRLGRRGSRESTLEQTGGRRLGCAVVWRWDRRTMDRVFLIEFSSTTAARIGDPTTALGPALVTRAPVQRCGTPIGDRPFASAQQNR